MSALIARSRHKALTLKGYASGVIILLSAIEDLLYVLFKYRESFSDWWSWTWRWIPVGMIFNGINSTYLILWCLVLNLFVLYWWGALKNVIALAARLADGLGFGYNTRAALITRGLAEMTRLGLTLGAQAETFAGLAGMGDLVLT